MAEGRGFTRRKVLQGALAGAATTGLAGFPFISYGQSDVIRIGHLTPRTGFLGPLGEFAVQAADRMARGTSAIALWARPKRAVVMLIALLLPDRML